MDALFLSCDKPHVARLAIGARFQPLPLCPAGSCKACPAASVRFSLSPRLIVRVPDEVVGVSGVVVTGAVTVTAITCAGLLPAVFVAVTVTVADPMLTPLKVRVSNSIHSR